jgi:hypothetical protein
MRTDQTRGFPHDWIGTDLAMEICWRHQAVFPEPLRGRVEAMMKESPRIAMARAQETVQNAGGSSDP